MIDGHYVPFAVVGPPPVLLRRVRFAALGWVQP